MADQEMDVSDADGHDARADYFAYRRDSEGYVGSFTPAQLPDAGLRLIGFYLPQFHPIPENDAWWGKGFTEWANVTRTVPQFKGHHQPHLPGELGFYDLRTEGIQERQVELARQAGLSAFCMYFYWFNGKRLLETPIEQFAANEAIDFEFCLCWANENWTRRWDGRDDDVLIGQSYNDGDDIAFISYLSRYLRNPRYLRIDGKPLVMVYRPSLLPDMAATARRWRQWCSENGVGPIYLAYSRAFEKVDPAKYGFDGAVEFPPNETRWTPQALAPYTGPIERFNPAYAGELYEYADLIRSARAFRDPGYTIFRGACPSWDHEARLPGRAKTLVGSSPAAYREFLETVLDETLQRHADSEKRLVFINAWNEWAEGAHLEPDRRYGYAHLEATRLAVIRSSLRAAKLQPFRRLAVIIHAYYPDVLEEFIGNLRDIPVPCDVLVTTVEEHASATARAFDAAGLLAKIRLVANRGRDVAPFIETLRELEPGRYSHVLKLHTKKSLHHARGDSWRRDLYGKLTTPDSLLAMLGMFEEAADLGILGASGHLLSMLAYLNINEKKLRELALRMGIEEVREGDAFVAGTMFLARIEALLPLAGLGLSTADFEEETGQINGTLAHAIERALTYSANAAGLTVACLAEAGATGEALNYVGATRYGYARSRTEIEAGAIPGANRE